MLERLSGSLDGSSLPTVERKCTTSIDVSTELNHPVRPFDFGLASSRLVNLNPQQMPVQIVDLYDHTVRSTELRNTLTNYQGATSSILASATLYVSSPSAVISDSSSRFINNLNSAVTDAASIRKEITDIYSTLIDAANIVQGSLFCDPSPIPGQQFVPYWPDTCERNNWPGSELAGSFSGLDCADPLLAADILEGLVRVIDSTIEVLHRYQVLFITLVALFKGTHRSLRTANSVEGHIPYLTWPRPPTSIRPTEYSLSR